MGPPMRKVMSLSSGPNCSLTATDNALLLNKRSMLGLLYNLPHIEWLSMVKVCVVAIVITAVIKSLNYANINLS